MKKMNKMYEAPMAEVIEMQMPVVLTISCAEVHSDDPIGGPDPWG